MPKGKISIHLEQVPLEGETLKEKVDVPAQQVTTVAIIAEDQKISLKGKNIYVDGKPADKDTPVNADSVVRFTERPRGS